jgi:hypothetical protein
MFDSQWRPPCGLSHSSGADRERAGRLPLDVESGRNLVSSTCSAMVVGGRLQVDWIYSRELRRETVTRSAERMLEVLRGLLRA